MPVEREAAVGMVDGEVAPTRSAHDAGARRQDLAALRHQEVERVAGATAVASAFYAADKPEPDREIDLWRRRRPARALREQPRSSAVEGQTIAIRIGIAGRRHLTAADEHCEDTDPRQKPRAPMRGP